MASYETLAPASSDPADAHLVIREILPGMVTFSVPFVSRRRFSGAYKVRRASA